MTAFCNTALGNILTNKLLSREFMDDIRSDNAFVLVVCAICRKGDER